MVPREFTRLDEIAEILFTTAEDIKQEDAQDEDDPDREPTRQPKPTPVVSRASHTRDECIERVQSHLKKSLLKRSRARFETPDGNIVVNCVVSKEYSPESRPESQPFYWFAFHPHQRDFLKTANEGYAAFGCGSKEQLLLVPYSEIGTWLDGMWVTESEDRFYWHVRIYREDGKYILRRRKGESPVDLTGYLIPSE